MKHIRLFEGFSNDEYYDQWEGLLMLLKDKKVI